MTTLPEIAQFEAMAKEILRRCMAEEDPEDIRKWLVDVLARFGAGDASAIMTWEQSFDFVDRMVAEYEERAATPEALRKELTWPWQSWRNLIDPLEEGMLGLITAPDGQGKTIYAETLAEHWASKKNHVVFVHCELNKRLMMLRRTARHTSITARDIKSGRLTQEQKDRIDAIRPRLLSWDGCITYLHTPGWSMDKTISELRGLHEDGLCDVVVYDYLEKTAANRRQLQMYGSNVYQREADNVEQLKTFAESTEIPTLMVAQMNKDAKKESFHTVDRSGITGAAAKSDKSNLVVMIKRERADNGYSNEVNVLVDKNTMGGTGTFTQIMQPEFFRVADPYVRTP